MGRVAGRRRGFGMGCSAALAYYSLPSVQGLQHGPFAAIRFTHHVFVQLIMSLIGRACRDLRSNSLTGTLPRQWSAMGSITNL